MANKQIASIRECFGDIVDHRVSGRCRYHLLEVITIAICASLAGAETWVDIETFGKSKAHWLAQFLELKHGIPSHDTFGDIFAMIDGDAFQRSFARWVADVFTLTGGQVIRFC